MQPAVSCATNDLFAFLIFVPDIDDGGESQTSSFISGIACLRDVIFDCSLAALEQCRDARVIISRLLLLFAPLIFVFQETVQLPNDPNDIPPWLQKEGDRLLKLIPPTWAWASRDSTSERYDWSDSAGTLESFNYCERDRIVPGCWMLEAAIYAGQNVRDHARRGKEMQ